jgi:lipopolysaccharide heptosyltransferase II
VKEKHRSFLIINPFGIGDVLFSTPFIRNIKESFSSAKIFYLCNKRTCPILENHPLVDKTFIYERDEFEAIKKVSNYQWIKKLWGFISEIKKENIDVAIDLSLNTQFGFFSWLAGIKTRIGYNYKNRGFFLTKKIKFSGYNDKHVADYYLGLLEFIGIEPRHKKIELFLKEEHRERANALCRKYAINDNDSLIVIAPCGGASWGAESFRKHWAKDKFAELADKLIEKFKVKIIFAGNRNERNIIEEIERLMRHVSIKVIDLPLGDFLALLNKAKIIVANDGGPLHMGLALGIKTVSIFGPVDERVYGPYSEEKSKHIVIKKDLSCRPCYRGFRLAQCHLERKCLNEITVDDVFSAVESLLRQN